MTRLPDRGRFFLPVLLALVLPLVGCAHSPSAASLQADALQWIRQAPTEWRQDTLSYRYSAGAGIVGISRLGTPPEEEVLPLPAVWQDDRYYFSLEKQTMVIGGRASSYHGWLRVTPSMLQAPVSAGGDMARTADFWAQVIAIVRSHDPLQLIQNAHFTEVLATKDGDQEVLVLSGTVDVGSFASAGLPPSSVNPLLQAAAIPTVAKLELTLERTHRVPQRLTLETREGALTGQFTRISSGPTLPVQSKDLTELLKESAETVQ